MQFGGPVGTRGDLEGKGDALAAELARRLGLGAGPCWQVERDGIGEFASWLSLVAGSLGKIGQDAALMAQNEVGEVRLAGGGGSSAMPHKSNPVLAETLVTLARFSAGLAGTLHQSARRGKRALGRRLDLGVADAAPARRSDCDEPSSRLDAVPRLALRAQLRM